MANFRHYIWLFGISILAIWQAFELVSWPENVRSLLVYLPYLIIVFGMFISVFMNRVMPIFLFLFIGLLNLANTYYMPTSGVESLSAIMLLALLPLLLPVNIILWTCLKEKGVNTSLYNLFLSLILFSQIGIVYFVMELMPIDFISFLKMNANIYYFNLPVLALITLIIGWLLLVLKNAYVESITVLERASVFLLILMAIAINQIAEENVFTWLSSVSALLVVIAIIFDSHKIAYTDQLTGLPSRRAMLEHFLGLGKKYSVAMMDIDHFKKFNDTYGHDIGDKVLVLVANELSNLSVGKAYRFGGEEFAVVFAKKTAEQVEQALETVRVNIENIDLAFLKTDNKKNKPKITVSFGLAEKTKQHANAEAVLKSADEALYDAKKAGRNRVKIYHEQ